MTFKELEWTDEIIEEFYRYWSEHPELYFSEAFGDTIIQFSKRKIGKLGHVLDFGSGSGGLVAALSRHGIKCYGLDLGNDSKKRVIRRFADDQNVQGIIEIEKIPQLKEQFDTVFLIETIEHLSDIHLERTMEAIAKALKPGGWLVISSPNKENLDASKVYCPVSKLVFHPMQHLRSWNDETLFEHLRNWKYVDIFCVEIDLNSLPYHSISNWIKYLFKRTFLKDYIPPHLFAFARKSQRII